MGRRARQFLKNGSVRSPAGDQPAAAAFHLLYAAADAKAEFDLDDAVIVNSHETQQAAQSPEKFGYALAQVSRLPATRAASPGQYTGNGIAGIDDRDYVGRGGERR